MNQGQLGEMREHYLSAMLPTFHDILLFKETILVRFHLSR